MNWPFAAGAAHNHLPSWGYLLDIPMDYGYERMNAPAWSVPGGETPTPDRPGHPLLRSQPTRAEVGRYVINA